MREIYLYGALGKSFGRVHEFEVNSMAEVMQALMANWPSFANKIRHGFYKVVVGDPKKGTQLDENTIAGFELKEHSVHIVPVSKGRRGGLGKILAGVLLISLAVVTGGASLAAGALTTTGFVGGAMVSMGTGLILNGVAQLIAPSVDDTGEKQKSFTSGGPQTTTREGGIVPIAYGEVVTGGTMISGVLEITNSFVSENQVAPPTGTPTTITYPRLGGGRDN